MLDMYRKKRDFGKTKEPKGGTRGKNGRKTRKFVVQHHLARKDHYDFRLEWNGVLLSWAVPKGPSYNPQDKRLAVKVEDHPIEYADFEGVIPKGEYGGGTVMLWDEGEWFPQTDFSKGLKNGSLKIELSGERLKGKWALVRMKTDGEKGENWLLIKEKDGYAKNSEGISRFKRSVRSGRSMADINADECAKNPFDKVEVQLAKLVDEAPSGDEWIYEVKYDGYRIVAFAEGGKVRFITRNGLDFTDKFKTLAEETAKWAKDRAFVLDGEMIVTDEEGRSDFQALQNYVKKPNGRPLTYMAFDILAENGEDLRSLPLRERKKKLKKLLKEAPAFLKFSSFVVGKGKESFSAAEKLGLEGVVGKRFDAPYAGTRNGDWIKLKCRRRQEFVVGGFTRTEKKKTGVSALLLGCYEGKKLVYCGRAGTGMSERESAELAARFEKIKRKTPPFINAPKPQGKEVLFWIRPIFVAETEYAERTDEGLLRQASFKGLREDKAAAEVADERAEQTSEKNVVCGVEISNPKKIVYKKPQVEKIDVVRYYERVSERMLKYAGGRVLSVVRCHKGVNEACFFKKHPATKSAGVSVVSIANGEGEKSDYFYIEDVRGLISEAQLGSLEFHIWGSKVKTLEKPDMMVFDLDPDEGLDLQAVRQGVRDLKSVLDKLSLKSFLKTSGGKGYHVVVPFKPKSNWDKFHDFAESIALLMAEKWPDRYTANIRKASRRGKIFIDWARNGRGATSVAPYSLRARPGAKVSMPISWRELDKIAPDGVDMAQALERLKKADPWKDYFKTEQKFDF